MKRVTPPFRNTPETPERLETRDEREVRSSLSSSSTQRESAPNGAHSERVRSVAELAAITWDTYAPDRRDERAIAGARVRDVVGEGVEPDLALAALVEWARGRDATGEPYHAIGFTSAVCRARVARLREERYAAEKRARAAGEPPPPSRPERGLVGVYSSVNEFLVELAKRAGP